MAAGTTHRRTGSNTCCAINCSKSRYKCPGKSFFRFPKDENRCKVWVQNIRREDLLKKDVNRLHSSGGYFLCSDHFEDSQFMNSNDKRRLIWNAVPTIFNIPNPPPKLASTRHPPTKRTSLPEKAPSISKKIRISEQQDDCESHPDRYPSPHPEHSEEEKANTAECDRQPDREQDDSESQPDRNPSPYSRHNEEEKTNTAECDKLREKEESEKEETAEENAIEEVEQSAEKQGTPASESEDTAKVVGVSDIPKWTSFLLGSDVCKVWLAIKTEQGLSSDDDTALFLLHFYQHHKPQGKSSSRDCVICGSPVSRLCTACVQRQTQFKQNLNVKEQQEMRLLVELQMEPEEQHQEQQEKQPQEQEKQKQQQKLQERLQIQEQEQQKQQQKQQQQHKQQQQQKHAQEQWQKKLLELQRKQQQEQQQKLQEQWQRQPQEQQQKQPQEQQQKQEPQKLQEQQKQVQEQQQRQPREQQEQSRSVTKFRSSITEIENTSVTRSRPASVTVFRPPVTEIRRASVTQSNSSATQTGPHVSSSEVQTDNRQSPPTVLKCPICERAFSSRLNLRVHVRETHWNSLQSQTAKTIRCQTCKIEFLSLWELKAHRLKEHPATSTSVSGSSSTGEELNEMKKKESVLGGELMEQEEKNEFDGWGELKEKQKEEFGELMEEEEVDYGEELNEKEEEEFDGWGELKEKHKEEFGELMEKEEFDYGEELKEKQKEEFDGSEELPEKKKREAEELSEKKKREAEMYRELMEKKKSTVCSTDQSPCEQCGKIVFNRNMRLHKRIHSGEKPFHCSKCGRSFKSLSELKNHKKLHGDQGKLTCLVCSKTFTFLKAFKSHQQAHERQRLKKESAGGEAVRTQCEECGKVMWKGSLLKHKQIHTDQKPHLCATCGKSYKTYACLSRHKKKHTTQQKHACALCDKTFTTSYGLKSHRLVHDPESEKPHVCPTCGKTFKYQRNYFTHRQVFHSSLDPFRFKCEKCGKGFFYESFLKQHMPLHDAGRKRPYRPRGRVKDATCRECGLKLSSTSNLCKHMKIHRNLKSYRCEVCPKRFNTSDCLNQHRKTHLKKKQ